MKQIILIATLAFCSFSHAAQRINISTKTGARISNRADCQSAEIVRYARGSYSVGQTIMTQNPENQSVVIAYQPVCEKNAAIPVVTVDESATCVSILEPQAVQCQAVSESSPTIHTTSSGLIFLRGDKKVYQAILSTSQNQDYDFSYNNVAVYDVNLEKIEMSLNSKDFDQEALKARQIQATVLIEDNL